MCARVSVAPAEAGAAGDKGNLQSPEAPASAGATVE